jgi:hypothetical protein
MSNQLAVQSTTQMASATTKDPAWTKAYMESLINPFSMAMKSPKILDGEIKYTAGLKLRATGEIICSPTLTTNIIVFPGLTNVICYSTNPIGGTDPVNALIDGAIFKQHISTESDRKNVRLARLTGAGLRLFLSNSAEEDDGYWEAARLTTQRSADGIVKLDTTGTSTGTAVPKVMDGTYELANNPTYQFGHLRDIHKYVFKLNSTDNDHKFSSVAGLDESATTDSSIQALTDLDQWDMIFIKIRGRRNPTSPSILRFDTVANQEVVYAENSPLGRMMDDSQRDPNIDGFLEYSRIELPAFQAIP